MASFNLQQPFDLKVNLSEKEHNKTKEWIRCCFEQHFWFFVIRVFCFKKKTEGKIIRHEVQNCRRIFQLGKVNHCAVSILLN